MPKYNFPEGEILLIDKPKGWTSFDVIRKLQGATKYRKFGHAGTLDPLATGLLIICSGRKTKTINEYQGMPKEYLVEFYLGGETDTYDSEYAPNNYKDSSKLTLEPIQKTINQNFLGKIEQTPPIYSAVRINGQRAYKAARDGKKIQLKSREVEVFSFELAKNIPSTVVQFQDGQLKELKLFQATIKCSKGTYIRSLVHDLGQILGVGGYIKELRRTQIGGFSINNALDLDQLINGIKNTGINTCDK